MKLRLNLVMTCRNRYLVSQKSVVFDGFLYTSLLQFVITIFRGAEFRILMQILGECCLIHILQACQVLNFVDSE